MASKALLSFRNVSGNTWLLSNAQFHQPFANPQTTFRHIRCFRNLREASKQTNTPFQKVVAKAGPIEPKILWKTLGFSVAFSSASIVGAAIWEYENIRAHTQRVINHFQIPRVRRTGWRATVNTWWNSLDEGKKVFYPICLVNVLVFCAWHVPSRVNTMVKYFCGNPASSALCWPMVLSTFSHHSVFHLAANMFVLNSFSSPIISAIGKEQFLALYLCSGVMSSFASILYKTVFAMPGLSLGASGAIMGIVGFACTQFPDIRLSILFLPMFTFTAGMAIKAIVGFDTLGCIAGWRFFDHAAHLGGAAWGILWWMWGRANIWQKRGPVLTFWHELRNPPGSK